MADGGDFLAHYRSISNKLKKKFLRKTNAAEPSDQFAWLAGQCERWDLLEYAGLSWVAVSRCEASLGHTNEEAMALSKAARHFIEAHKRSIVPVPQQLQAGLKWMRESWEKLGGGLCLETGRKVEVTNPYEAVTAYSSAVEMNRDSPPQHLHALSRLASLHVSLGEYDSALSLYTEMVSTVNKITSYPFGVYVDILVRCETSRILLILVLRPTPQKLTPELAKLVEKYTWIGKPDPSTTRLVGEEMFFLLQSLVMGCQSDDAEALAAVEGELWHHLNNEQRELLRIIVDNINSADK